MAEESNPSHCISLKVIIVLAKYNYIINLKHGKASRDSKGNRYSKEYRTWLNVKQRCLNPNNSSYEDYAGRGITVCEEWAHSFEAFYKDMGDAPDPEYSIERIDNNKGYEPSNCIWATNETQQRNSRNTKLSPALVSYIRRNKHKYTVEDLANKFSVCVNTIRDVLNYKTWKNIPNVPSFLLAKTWGEILTIYS